LILEVWTDGSLNPEEAVATPGKFLKEQLPSSLTLRKRKKKRGSAGEEGDENSTRILPECG
jgi:DNA-directed RNA polymerase alpha subunit